MNVSLKFIDSPKFRKAEKSSANLVKAEGAKSFIDLKFKYSNTVDKETDPMDLHISLLNSQSLAITNLTCSFENFSQLSNSSKGSFAEKLDMSNCPADFVTALDKAAS